MSIFLSSFFQNAMLLGAIQGIIFSGFAFFSKKYKSKSTFFLGLLILTFSYNILQNYMVVSNLFTLEHYFNFLYFPFSSVFLVLFYLYVKSFLYPDRKLTRFDYLLFLPFLVALLESIFEKTGYATGFFDNSDAVSFNNFRITQEVFNVGYSFVLIILSYRFILKFEKQQQTGKSKFPKIRLTWLKIITLAFFVLCLYWIVPLYFEFQYRIEEAVLYFYTLWIGLSLSIYILGHVGIYHFGIVQEQKKIREFQQTHSVIAIIEEITSSQNKNITAFEKFIKQDKNYLDSNLSLEMAAKHLNINKSHLSRIINSELGKNFSDYVNELRIEEAKSYLANPEFFNYTLEAIGLEAGFNSKTAFNNAFKKFTETTPSDYKKSVQKHT